MSQNNLSSAMEILKCSFFLNTCVLIKFCFFCDVFAMQLLVLFLLLMLSADLQVFSQMASKSYYLYVTYQWQRFERDSKL